MKRKKWMAGVAMLVMSVCLLLPASVQAREPVSGQSSSTTITTQVPETHKAMLTIVGNGTVTVNAQTCKGEASNIEVKIPRLTKTEWRFSPADGYTLEKVLYNGADVTDALADNTYTAGPVYEDGTEVQVTFVRKSSGLSGKDESAGSSGSNPSSNTPSGTSGTDSPKTGDDTATGLWAGAMIVSAILVLSCLMMYRRKRG